MDEKQRKIDLEGTIKYRIESWQSDWGVIAKAFVDKLGLTMAEAIAYLQLSELASIRNIYRDIYEMQKKYMPEVMDLTLKHLKEHEENDDWKGDKDE